ncbi:MAG: hypothetical protein Q8M57_14330 [Nitrosomonas sp.]|uniref:hypothetical protein n=1 Tax=Nitrosomonas sp. TaxID=42353 RepID=UPI002734B8CE|nr:hypothetical protein [Nitrosomonas sp.]MDP3282195.1 hypothetical protein [Nitrosomonas sp.]
MAFYQEFFLNEQLPLEPRRRKAPPNGACLFGKVRILISSFLMLVMLSGCVHQKFVTEPYPRWGDESSISQSGGNVPLILRPCSVRTH